MIKNHKITLLFLSLALVVAGTSLFVSPKASALSGSDFKANRIIDDQIFFSRDTISQADIQNFLNSKVPTCDTNGSQSKTYDYQGQTVTTSRAVYAQRNGYPAPPYTCLKDYTQNVPAKAADSYCSGAMSGGVKSASQIIYDVGQACGINQRVLLVLLQKEQGLITDDWPWPAQYESATGFGCPDTAACDPSFSGFTSQVYYGARQYRVYAQHPDWFNYVSGATNFVQYNPNSSCSGSSLSISTQATAGLYNYTPYQPNAAALNNLYGTGHTCSAYGNRNFWRLFNDWFGASIDTGMCLTPISGVSTGVNFTKARGAYSTANFMIYSGSATNCVEFHGWNPGFGSWKSHVASNSANINLANSAIYYADLDGNGVSEAILVGFRGTSSGMVEFHIWDPSLRKWSDHKVSNAPAIDPSVSQISFADLDGDGRDEGVLVGLRGSGTGSGNVEMHVWNAGFGSWKAHYQSNAPAIDPSVSQISFANVDGDLKAEGILIGLKKSATGSGNIEFHVWNPGFGSWMSHHASNQPATP